MTTLVVLLAVLVASMLDPLVAAIGISSFFIGRAWGSWAVAAGALFGLTLLTVAAILAMAGGTLNAQPVLYFARELMAAGAWLGLTVLFVRGTNGKGISLN